MTVKDSPRNRILCELSQRDLAVVCAQLKPLAFEARQRLEPRNRPISHVYFIESGIVAVVAVDRRQRSIEVGFVGHEGVTGLPAVLGGDKSPYEALVQVSGRGYRIEVDALRRAMRDCPTLMPALLRYAHVYMMQLASTAKANGLGKLEERLARWLLMAHDRLDGPELPVTHDMIAALLGVHRPGITLALTSLERQGLVDIRRGNIKILDRRGLEVAAGKLYGASEAEMDRLFVSS